MRKVLGKFLMVGVAAVAIGMGSQAKAVVTADLVFVVDESGSMGNVQTNLRNNIGAFASILSAGGVDATYSLVGYGNGAVRPRLLTDSTTAAAFATAAAGLVASGGTEPGYEASMAALNGGPSGTLGITFRAGAVKNVVILTDEPTNGDLAGANATTLDALLTSTGALYNGVLRGSSTINSYSTLIGNHGGTVFDLNAFNTTDQMVIDAFVQDFATRKLQEIIDQSNTVPEPITATLGLMGLGVLGAATRRRRAA